MKLLTRDTDYAMRALCYIAKSSSKVVTARELVTALKIPKPFLRKLLQKLNKAGVLNSYKGKEGGFKLALPTSHVRLVDIIKIFQGHFKLNECLFKKRACPNLKVCCLKRRIDKIERRVVRELESINIKELLDK